MTPAKDGLGRPVPAPLADSFDLAILDEALEHIRAVRLLVERLAEHPSGQWLPHREVLADIGMVESNLKAAKPHAVCPKCQGRACPSCRQRKMVTQQIYRALTK